MHNVFYNVILVHSVQCIQSVTLAIKNFMWKMLHLFKTSHYKGSPTFRLQTVRLLTTRLQQFVSTTIRLHYNSSPLLFVSTTIRLHYFSSPLFLVSRQFVSLRFVSNNSSPLLFVSITIHLHYYSSPLLFVSTKFVSNNSSPLIFGSITILLYIV